MAKRRLTRRQSWRIEKIQQERQARAQRREAHVETLLEDEHLGPEQEGRVIASYGASVDVEDPAGGLHRCHLRQHLGTPVCGDHVAWQAGSRGNGVVVAIRPRRSALIREMPDGGERPIAANLDRVGVVIATRPTTPMGLIDRYLVAAEHLGIHPFLVLNKIDLLGPGELTELEESLAVYPRIGYELIPASTVTAHGLDALRAALGGHTSVLVGQSGVGKSSLINCLIPSVEARTAGLSEATGKGMHTTTTARLYRLPGDGSLIDSPGVREFALGHIPAAEVGPAFIEFRPFLGHCRFRDCAHRDEPGCALRSAVDSDAIDPRRLASYHRIVASLAG
jgi:ribosome biogenesis GTPase